MAALRKAATRQCLVVFRRRRVWNLRQILKRRVAAILQLSEHPSEEVWLRRVLPTTVGRTVGAELQQLNQLIDARQIRRPGQARAALQRIRPVAAAKGGRHPALIERRTAHTRRKQELHPRCIQAREDVAVAQVRRERVAWARRSTQVEPGSAPRPVVASMAVVPMAPVWPVPV